LTNVLKEVSVFSCERSILAIAPGAENRSQPAGTGYPDPRMQRNGMPVHQEVAGSE